MSAGALMVLASYSMESCGLNASMLLDCESSVLFSGSKRDSMVVLKSGTVY